jgi:hypothetical protein|tara:strand:+ start:67 stop:465 length:399 start_codon:yes stop_codon:yes gene_type:complete
MKITLEKLYRSYSVFDTLLEQRLPLPLNLKFRNLVQQISPSLIQIESIQADLIEELGYEQDDDGSYLVEEHEHDEFLSKLEDKLQDEVEIDWKPLSVMEIADTKLSMKELEAISFLFYDIDEISQQSIAQTV